MGIADVGYVVGIQANHDEVFGPRDDTRIRKHLAVITAMRTPIGEEYQTNRFVVGLRSRNARFVRLPRNTRVVPVFRLRLGGDCCRRRLRFCCCRDGRDGGWRSGGGLGRYGLGFGRWRRFSARRIKQSPEHNDGSRCGGKTRPGAGR